MSLSSWRKAEGGGWFERIIDNAKNGQQSDGGKANGRVSIVSGPVDGSTIPGFRVDCGRGDMMDIFLSFFLLFIGMG